MLFEAKLPYEYSAFATGLIFYIGYKNVNKYKKRQNKRVRTQGVRTQLVPVAGVEPARYRYHWILSPARLPIPSHRQVHCILATKVLYTKFEICQPLKAHSVINFLYYFKQCSSFSHFPVFSKDKMFSIVVFAMLLSASVVRYAWCEVTSTFGIVISRASVSSSTICPE